MPYNPEITANDIMSIKGYFRLGVGEDAWVGIRKCTVCARHIQQGMTYLKIDRSYNKGTKTSAICMDCAWEVLHIYANRLNREKRKVDEMSCHSGLTNRSHITSEES